MVGKPNNLVWSGDSFNAFEFTRPDKNHGWGCSLKPDISPGGALSAATDIARYALALLQMKRSGQLCDEPDEWFHKADIALFNVTTDPEIQAALVRARVECARIESEPEIVNLWGTTAGNWHDWIWKTVSRFNNTAKKRQVQFPVNSLQDILPRLLSEAAHAQNLLQPEAAPAGLPGVRNRTHQRAVFANEQRSSLPQPTWKEITARWNAENPNDLAEGDHMKDAYRRAFKKTGKGPK